MNAFCVPGTKLRTIILTWKRQGPHPHATPGLEEEMRQHKQQLIHYSSILTGRTMVQWYKQKHEEFRSSRCGAVVNESD